MRRLWGTVVTAFALGLVLLTLGTTTAVRAATLPAQPDANYYDGISLLDQETTALVTKQNDYYQTTKAKPQVVLAAIKSTGGDDIDSYAPDLFQKWGIGQKGKDNGILILFAKNGGKNNVRIEVGYGMEAYMTDAKSANLLNAHLSDLKSSKAANVNRGLRAVFKGVAEVVSRHYGYKVVSADGTQSRVARTTNSGNGGSAAGLIVKAVGVIVILVIIIAVLFGGGSGGSGRGGRRRGSVWPWLLLGMSLDGTRRSRPDDRWGGPGGFGGGGFGGGGFGGGGFGGGSSGGGGASV